MSLSRKSRFYYLLVLELAQKYTKALIFGFVLGIIGSLSVLRLSPYVLDHFFYPVERIGVVGEYTPTTLPLSIQELISYGLTTINEDGSAKGAIATRWEISEDGKTYTFFLQPNVKWHTGKLMTAYDINYNIRDVTLTPVDDHTLRVTLKEPYSPFPTLFAKPIIQAGLVGFGPYRVESIRLKGPNVEYLKIIPKDKHSGKGKEYRFYITEQLAIDAYKLGDIDMIDDLASITEFENLKNTKTESTVRYDRIVGLFINTHDQLLSDKSLRQGLGYIVPDLGEEKARSPISIKSWAYSESVKKYTYDEAQGMKLLKNAMDATSSSLLTITTFAPYVNIAQIIADSWTAFGLPTRVRVENSLPPDFQILLSAQTIPPDPDQYPFWHSTQNTTNITGYANVKIDKLLEDGRREMDTQKRQKIYSDFARFLTDDSPVLFLYYPKMYSIKRAQ